VKHTSGFSSLINLKHDLPLGIIREDDQVTKVLAFNHNYIYTHLVSMNIRNINRLSPEYALLGFLFKHPSHGYELHLRLLEEFGNIWHASQSQTYNILKRLEAQGYITSTTVEQEKRPRRKLLHITESGITRFETWLKNPTKSSVHAIRVEFITRLYFVLLYYPQKAQEMIWVQIDTVNAGLNALQEELANLSESQTVNRLALELRNKLLKSVIGWLNECDEIFTKRNYL
jgi:DNA-binding PadR family transcriptional regulator